MTRSYLIAGEYLEAAEAARGRVFRRDDWISVLLALHPREEYLHLLAALNHAACSRQSIDEYRDRFLDQLPRVDADAARAATFSRTAWSSSVTVGILLQRSCGSVRGTTSPIRSSRSRWLISVVLSRPSSFPNSIWVRSELR
jgi:hypothetical protein